MALCPYVEVAKVSFSRIASEQRAVSYFQWIIASIQMLLEQPCDLMKRERNSHLWIYSLALMRVFLELESV